MMGSKKKNEHSKSRKKHKHKKHKKKKEKVIVTDLLDAHESSDFEATASTQEALEQYDRILSALESEKDELKGTIPQEVEAVSDASSQSESDKRMNTQDANSLTRQPSDVRESSDMLPCSEAKESLKVQIHDKENLQNKDCQVQDKNRSKSQSSSRDSQSKSMDQSKSKSHQSRNRGHSSKSRENRSRSRGHRSRSRDGRSRSRGRQSRSRGRQSRSRGRRSRSRGRQSRSREYRSRNRGHRSRSRDRHSRRRHYRSFSRSSSRGRSRSHERRRRQHHYHERRRRRSSRSRSRTPKRKTKIVIEKAEPQLGSLESFTTLCRQLVTQVQELPEVNFPVADNENTISQEQIKAPFNIGTSNTQSRTTR